MTERRPEPIASFPIVYVGFDDQPIQMGNTFLVQVSQDEIILSVGQLAPPILIGTAEEAREQAKGVPFVPVKILARYGMTTTRARELVDLLAGQLAKYDEHQGKQGTERANK